MNLREQWAQMAVLAACKSTCSKSKRGAVLYATTWTVSLSYDAEPSRRLVGAGWNSPPNGFSCDGSLSCHSNCNKVAVHAEERVLLNFFPAPEHVFHTEYDLIHAKVNKDGILQESGGPSCWQCSRMILDAGIHRTWLYHSTGWQWYSPEQFHELTLEACGLPVVKAPA